MTITEEQGAAFIEVRSRNFPKETLSGMGLFALIGQNGTVRDLRLENARVLRGSASGSRYVGLLAGTCYGTVERVSVQGTVSGNSYTGGMIGQLMSLGSEAVVRDCTAEVEVECNRYVGGLIGISSGRIAADCQVSGRYTQFRMGRLPLRTSAVWWAAAPAVILCAVMHRRRYSPMREPGM